MSAPGGGDVRGRSWVRDWNIEWPVDTAIYRTVYRIIRVFVIIKAISIYNLSRKILIVYILKQKNQIYIYK